ncbi:hypothetical protein FACS1894198_6430 [Clostridia bacterium]|nr:hypothetical protein FACS1894198_6430 [Clostridia bacterium]
MDSREYLQQIKRFDSIVKSKIEQQKRVQNMLCQTEIYPMQDKLVELDRKLNNEIKQLYETKNKIESAINAVSNTDLRLLLTLRYLNSKTWPEIAAEMRYSVAWLHKLHNRAFCELKNILKRR